jgi:hypothetical protein
MKENYNSDLCNLNLLDYGFSNVSASLSESTVSNLSQSVASLDSLKKVKNEIKRKFIFTKPFTTKVKNQDVDFKIGEIVEGVVIRNEKTSEPPNFFQFSTKYGDVRLGYGGRASSVIAPYTETVLQSDSKLNAPEAKTPEVEITQEDDKILGMPKGLAIGLGIAVLAIGGYIAYKKFKK